MELSLDTGDTPAFGGSCFSLESKLEAFFVKWLLATVSA